VRRNVWYLALTFIIIGGAFTATLVSGTSPILGLDLQGGISVTLNPVKGTKSSSLDQALEIIRNRVDGLGVAEPEISRQGDTIVVDLPGVKDRAKAESIIGRTAELRFRPVLGALPPYDPKAASTTTTTTTTIAGATATAPTTDGSEIPTTTPAEDKPGATVILPDRKQGNKEPGRYQLGPTELTGKAISGAKAQFQNGSWAVNVDFTDAGGGKWDELGQKNFKKQVAIVLDGVVQSAPVIQGDNQAFESFGGKATISGSFSESEAKDLALVLRYGALPVKFDADNQKVQSVSPTLGKDQLRAGIVSGLIGLALVALFMLAYYRLLGAVVILGLALTGMAIYSLVSYLGQSIGLTLTLAGVTGLIVSVGVTVDSYVVYFERLKDEVRTGKTVRSSVDRGFVRSWRTILAADIVSLIGAGVLYWLAIGSVRGFAFFLGVSTLLDLIIAYFFMHPIVSLMARRRGLVRAPKVGIAAGLDASGGSPASKDASKDVGGNGDGRDANDAADVQGGVT
jgi:preprotein translocase subunit SecD